MQDEARYTEAEAEQIAEFSRETYNDYLSEYKELHKTVSETRTRRVFADTHGYELNQFADELGIDREAVSAWMHDKDGSGYDWSTSDPVVLLKE